MLTVIISAVVVGTVIGGLGRLVLPGRQDVSVLLTILVGIVAALVGTAISRAFGIADTNGIDWIELIIQIALAAVGVGLLTGTRSRVR
jgi:uncharacterized membrane protein YeaQ/YmgE (transglycosylase-associated protein family)